MEFELSTQIYRVYQLHRKKIREVLKEYDITSEQWMVLGRLYRNRGEYNQKYVTRERSNQDRREFIIHITGKGKDFYEETLPAAITAQKEIKALISSKESDQIMKILKKMEKGLERELE